MAFVLFYTSNARSICFGSVSLYPLYPNFPGLQVEKLQSKPFAGNFHFTSFYHYFLSPFVSTEFCLYISLCYRNKRLFKIGCWLATYPAAAVASLDAVVVDSFYSFIPKKDFFSKSCLVLQFFVFAFLMKGNFSLHLMKNLEFGVF